MRADHRDMNTYRRPQHWLLTALPYIGIVVAASAIILADALLRAILR